MVRSQLHHEIDIISTLLEVIGFREPVEVLGYGERSIEGASLAYSFFKEIEGASSQRTQQ